MITYIKSRKFNHLGIKLSSRCRYVQYASRLVELRISVLSIMFTERSTIPSWHSLKKWPINVLRGSHADPFCNDSNYLPCNLWLLNRLRKVSVVLPILKFLHFLHFLQPRR